LLTAAVAEGKVCGAEIPNIGIRSEPNKAATTTRRVLEYRVKDVRLATISNALQPLYPRLNILFNLGKVFHI
jgi:hypothetical protein